ncbi:hypothetical protein AA14337_3004 [Acetobacter malorum DSM 14337]|uniref:Uncharacterized protein n=2 Tax=Acetobacter malorum TaxID=178901 RepID=A0ABQ0PZ19_9PROT|nr:hypothetical protein AD930_06245 [Acetobacter malorum]GBQ85144.1 hypothetical protein AA14337_3004 [Acetobacter malorum DSM 14337]
MTSLREQILSSLRSKVLETDIVQDISGSAEMPMILAIRPRNAEFQDMVVCVWLQETADTPPPSHQALLDTIGGDDTLRHKFFLLSSFNKDETPLPSPESATYAEWVSGTFEEVADIIAQGLAVPCRDMAERPVSNPLQAADGSDVGHSHAHGEDIETGGDNTSPPSEPDLPPLETIPPLHAQQAETTDCEGTPHPEAAETSDDREKETESTAAQPLDANDRSAEQEHHAVSLPVEQTAEHTSSHLPTDDVEPSGINEETFPGIAPYDQQKEEGGATRSVTSDASQTEPVTPTPAPSPMEEQHFAPSVEAVPQAEERGTTLHEGTVSTSHADEGQHGIADADEPEAGHHPDTQPEDYSEEEDEEDDGLPAMGSFPSMPNDAPSRSIPAGQSVTVNSGIPTLSTGGAPPLSSSDAIIMAMAATMSAIIGGSPCMFSGVEYSIHDLTDARGMLPVILVSAAQWACPLVLKTKGKGGFSFSMRSAQEEDGPSLLGFVVTALELSSPQTFLMAIAASLEQCVQFGGDGGRSLDMTPLMESFAMWGDHWGLFADDPENEDSFPAGGAE